MKKTDHLPNIIAGTALVIYLVFLFAVSRSEKDEPLQGGDIQKAIDTKQLD